MLERREAGLRRDDARHSPTGAASAKRSASPRARPPGRSRRPIRRSSRRRRKPPARASRRSRAQQPDAAAKKPADAEAAPDTAQAQPQEQPLDHGAGRRRVAGTVVHEFRSEEWGELYGKRVDEMIGVLKARNVPVFWVGLPSVRGARATAEMVYLNDLYRGARREGRHHLRRHLGRLRRRGRQLQQLRPGLRRPDAPPARRRRRAFHARRRAQARALCRARNAPRDAGARDAGRDAAAAGAGARVAKAPPTAAAPGLPPRPIAGPVMSLTAPRGAGDALLGGAPVRDTRPTRSRRACW